MTSKVILVADDDEDTRSIVCSTLEMAGHTIVQAKDGAQALGMYQSMSPDLIVLDVMMPYKSGTEVCAEIKGTPEGKYVPILMLTARDAVKDKVIALEGGADDYLTKPFHYQELQARAKALLRVRELNLTLRESNRTLQALQEKLIEQERQLLVNQLAGTAAHQLGQPLSAILLNCHLLEHLKHGDPGIPRAITAIKADARRMTDMIEKLRSLDARATEGYHDDLTIFSMQNPVIITTNKPTSSLQRGTLASAKKNTTSKRSKRSTP